MTAVTKKKAEAPPSESAIELLVQGQSALGITSVDLAKLLGVSPKTVYRWVGRRTSIAPMAVGALSHHVHRADAALARRMHAHAVTELSTMNLPLPPPLPEAAKAPGAVAPAPSLSASESTRLRVDAVIHAACLAMNVAPQAVRPALVAAFARARELELSVDDMAMALAPKEKPAKTAKR